MKRSRAAFRPLLVLVTTLLPACGGNPIAPTPKVVPPPPPPAPTSFRLTGAVTEPVGLPIDGAQILILAGTGQGRSVRTAQDGTYLFPDLNGDVTIEITRDGYVASHRDVTVDHDTALAIELAPVEAPASVAGDWRVTFAANGACPGIPEEARKRTYAATITQSGAAIVVDLSGAEFVGPPHFSGFVRGNRFAALLGDNFAANGVVEKLGEQLFLDLEGQIAATISPARIVGTLDGDFLIGSGPDRPYSAWCTDSNHTVTFERQ